MIMCEMDAPDHRVHIFIEMNRVSVSAHSAGAYTATLLVRVNVMRGGGRAVHPPPSPARTNFTLITECTPESSGCNFVYSVPQTDMLDNFAYTPLCYVFSGRLPPSFQHLQLAVPLVLKATMT
jgi:hypothetical protein